MFKLKFFLKLFLKNLLDEVVVSDSRFELKRENSGKTVIKISSQEIENNQGRTISELINTKSGIEINGSRSNAGSKFRGLCSWWTKPPSFSFN